MLYRIRCATDPWLSDITAYIFAVDELGGGKLWLLLHRSQGRLCRHHPPPRTKKQEMIAKAMTSHNIRRLANYLLRVGDDDWKEKTRPQIILSNYIELGGDGSDITSTINAINHLRGTNKVLHIAIAHPNCDMAKVAEIGEEKLINELIDGLCARGINLRDTAFAVVRHEDKDSHIDYHLLAASTDLNGKAINDSYIGRTAMHIANEISQKYGLSLNKRRGMYKAPQREIQRNDYTQSIVIDAADALGAMLNPQIDDYQEEQMEIELQTRIRNETKTRKKKKHKGLRW